MLFTRSRSIYFVLLRSIILRTKKIVSTHFGVARLFVVVVVVVVVVVGRADLATIDLNRLGW